MVKTYQVNAFEDQTAAASIKTLLGQGNAFNLNYNGDDPGSFIVGTIIDAPLTKNEVSNVVSLYSGQFDIQHQGGSWKYQIVFMLGTSSVVARISVVSHPPGEGETDPGTWEAEDDGTGGG